MTIFIKNCIPLRSETVPVVKPRITPLILVDFFNIFILKTFFSLDTQIIDNLTALFNTGIPEIKEIVSELVVMLPLKSKHIITLCKNKILTPLMVHSLSTSDGILLSKKKFKYLLNELFSIFIFFYHQYKTSYHLFTIIDNHYI